jgi:glutathione synthase/RimK-type ligase-like ATP-grasp enzyme
MTLPDPARYAMDAAQAMGADYADLDQGGGYLWRVSKGGRSVVGGAGGVSSFPINSATAFTLSRDKAHTKTVLHDAGLPVIPGGLFFAHQRRIALRGPGREIDDAIRYAVTHGFPVFCKPNHGARGNFAEIVLDADALRDYASRVAVEFESFLVEPVIEGTEHRVLVHDGRPVFHSTKATPALTGDGITTLEALLAQLNDRLEGSGVSPSPAAAIALAGRKPTDVLEKGERIPLPGRRNLSAAGGAETVSTVIPAQLAYIAIRAVAALGLRIGAVDIFDVSRMGDLSDLVIIEVNGNPGLKTLELAERPDLIRAIFVAMFTELLEG